MRREYLSKSLSDTIKIGEEISKLLPKGSVIEARGDLGVGKTALAKGIAKGLGVREVVNSPTFVIVKTYEGELCSFYHIDAYRLEGENEVTEIGLDELLGDEMGISFVEWGQFIKDYLKDIKKNYFIIDISIVDDENRKIIIEEKYE